MMFASRASHVEASGIRKMFESAPPGAINLGLGEPDIQPPPKIMEALKKAIDGGMNKYGPTGGVPELRQAVAERLSKFSDVKPDCVLITTGATEALCVAMQTLVDHGDEVLIPDPGFVLFGPHVRLAGGVPVSYPLTKENGFIPKIDELRSLVTSKTKMIIVNSPANPTGAVFDKRKVQEIADFAKEEGLIVVTDEVYDAIVYEGPHESFLGRCENTVYVNSFSKVFAMTGWRLGYLTAPADMIKQMAKIHYYMVACPPTPTQYAVLAGLREPEDYVPKMVREFAARREIIVKELNKIPGFDCQKPKGAFYAWPSYSADMGSEEMALKILSAGVICTPGRAFGERGERHLRFSYANSQDNIRKAMERIKALAETDFKGRVK